MAEQDILTLVSIRRYRQWNCLRRWWLWRRKYHFCHGCVDSKTWTRMDISHNWSYDSCNRLASSMDDQGEDTINKQVVHRVVRYFHHRSRCEVDAKCNLGVYLKTYGSPHCSSLVQSELSPFSSHHSFFRCTVTRSVSQLRKELVL